MPTRAIRTGGQAEKLQTRSCGAERRYVASDFILGEAITYLYPAIGAASAQGFINTVFTTADAGAYQLGHVSPAQFRRPWQLRQRYHD